MSLARLPLAALPAVLSILLSLHVATAQAETVACNGITSLPVTISAPGVYCLHQDVTTGTNQNMVVITADDVVLDCNGHTLRMDNANSTGYGVWVRSSRVTVRDCVIDNFFVGIMIQDQDTKGSRIEGNTLLRSRLAGIRAEGLEHRIEGNRIHGNRGYSGVTRGIYLHGLDDGEISVIRNNIISDFKPEAGAAVIGIAFAAGNLHVTGNTLSGLYSTEGVYGILGTYAPNVATRENTILSGTTLVGFAGPNYYGIRLTGTGTYGAVCRDNVVGHFDTNILGCIEGGNTKF